MIIYTVSWHEKQIKSCKKQIDIQDYINCIHVDLKKTCLEMQWYPLPKKFYVDL